MLWFCTVGASGTVMGKPEHSLRAKSRMARNADRQTGAVSA
ncbi:MAG: hypothetical protein NZ585_14340 [Chloracidobacterium sp.]|nr:hypothetical protein [Chloracidobacterium sp.]MDW8216692.1 hypothetical protein [Acidobacteriota bacterium]